MFSSPAPRSAAHGAAWEADFLVGLERGGHPVAVVRRCVDVVELVAVAATGQGRAALVAADLPRLDRTAVDRLLAAEVVPVGVVPRGDAAALERLRAVGIDVSLPDDADAAVVSAVVFWRHSGNIQRLLAGTEPRIGQKR